MPFGAASDQNQNRLLQERRPERQDPNVEFDFLGYCFRPRAIKSARDNKVFCRFNPAVSPSALNAMRSKVRSLKLRRQTQLALADLAKLLNQLLRGWIEYYGRYRRSELYPLFRYVNMTVLAWARRKFKHLGTSVVRAGQFLGNLTKTCPDLFVHWRLGMIGAFA